MKTVKRVKDSKAKDQERRSVVLTQTWSEHFYENNKLHSYSPVSHMEYLSHSTPDSLYLFSNRLFGFTYIVRCKTLNLIYTILLQHFSDVQTSINYLLVFFSIVITLIPKCFVQIRVSISVPKHRCLLLCYRKYKLPTQGCHMTQDLHKIHVLQNWPSAIVYSITNAYVHATDLNSVKLIFKIPHPLTTVPLHIHTEVFKSCNKWGRILQTLGLHL